MQSEYFEGKVERMICETEEIQIPVVKKLSFFRKEVCYRTEQTTTHYALCSLIGTKFLFRIPIEGTQVQQFLKVGDKVSIHLNFEYGYTCFHYDRPKQEPKILEV